MGGGLGTEASTRKVDTLGLLPAFDWVRAHARLERSEDLHLPRLAHGLMLITLGCHAKVEVDREQDILDGDDRVPRGVSDIWPDIERPDDVPVTAMVGWRRAWRGRSGTDVSWTGRGGNAYRTAG